MTLVSFPPSGWRLGLSQTTLENLCIQILVSSACILDVDIVDSGMCEIVCVREVCVCVKHTHTRTWLTVMKWEPDLHWPTDECNMGRWTERQHDWRCSQISLMIFTKPRSTSFCTADLFFIYIIKCQWKHILVQAMVLYLHSLKIVW